MENENKQINPNLIPCRSCGHMVAKSAKKCPQCGAKLKKSWGCLTAILIALLIPITIFGVIFFRTSPYTNRTKIYVFEDERLDPMFINVNWYSDLSVKGASEKFSNIHKEFHNNKYSAEQRYVGKTIIVQGKIKAIKGPEKKYIINKGYADVGATVVIRGISCYFKGSWDDLEKFKAGDEITIIGEVAGMENILFDPTHITLYPSYVVGD